MMKKVQKALITALCLAVGACALTACGDDKPDNTGGGNKVTVTFYDATGTNTPSQMTVIKTEKIDKGSTVDSFVPTKDGGYEFVNWFATPSKSHKFDFTEEITDNISIYGGFSKYVEDTRDFYVIGAGTSNILIDGWGVINDGHKFTKAANKNEYTLSLDLRANDQFVIVSNVKYYNKHGAGYLNTMTLANGTEVFAGQGSPYDDSYSGANIIVKYDGHYTLKLTTHPNEDWYNTAGEGYTEEDKEIYARNPYDTIEWTRDGDCINELEIVTDFFIKGNLITNWKDMYNASTKMTNNDGVYSLSVYLKKDDEFMFSSTNTVGETVGVGSEYIRSTNLDEASKAYLGETAGKNMTAKESGKYTFTYTKDTGVLSVAFDGTATEPAADYYIDGTFSEGVDDWGGYCFNPNFKLTETEAGSGIYEIKNVAMKADSQIIIQAFKEGSTERGTWGTEGYNGLGSYNYTYLYDPDKAFEAVGGGNNNIKVKTAGTYDITFDSYAKMITITAHVAE